LTHSIEVAQIAKSIALKINTDHHYFIKNNIDLDVIEFAGLAHDLGHPPFGHVGERILDRLMIEKGDGGGFEGNAQTLRILTRLEKKYKHDKSNSFGIIEENGNDGRYGLNLTARILASILKYNKPIPSDKKEREKYYPKVVQGYYKEDENIVKFIKESVTGISNFNGKFKTIECQIMDFADDIANACFDLEDALKANFVSIHDFLVSEEEDIVTNIESKSGLDNKKIIENLMFIVEHVFNPYEFITETTPNNYDLDLVVYNTKTYRISKEIQNNGYYRSLYISALIERFVDEVFIQTFNNELPALSVVAIKEESESLLKVLKYFIYYFITKTSRIQIPEFRGKEILTRIYDNLNVTDIHFDGDSILPVDLQNVYNKLSDKKTRVICDFIAGMTDSYVKEFYGRLVSENPQSIFKTI
jgi:dGTPase